MQYFWSYNEQDAPLPAVMLVALPAKVLYVVASIPIAPAAKSAVGTSFVKGVFLIMFGPCYSFFSRFQR